MPMRPSFKILSLYLIVALLALSLPVHGWAMFIPAGDSSSDRTSDRARIQSLLESTALKQRLADLGLSPETAATKINALSDEQVHQLAANADSLQAGGDAVGGVIFLLLVAVVVVVVLEATGHQIIIKR